MTPEEREQHRTSFETLFTNEHTRPRLADGEYYEPLLNIQWEAYLAGVESQAPKIAKLVNGLGARLVSEVVAENDEVIALTANIAALELRLAEATKHLQAWMGDSTILGWLAAKDWLAQSTPTTPPTGKADTGAEGDL